jgi:hypothetical protein
MQPPPGLFVFREKSEQHTMKEFYRTAFLFLFLAASLMAYSQEKEYRTIFDNKELRISGVGGPFMQFTAFAGEFGHMMGGGGAVLLNNFYIGGYGLGLTNAIPDYVNDHTNDRLSLGHGGFWIGYSLFGEKPIHVSVSTLVGWGEFGIMQYDGYYPFIRDKIFTLAPTIELEVNLTRYFRIGAGATYNLYTGVDELRHGYDSGDLSNPGGFLSFKFGWF